MLGRKCRYLHIIFVGQNITQQKINNNVRNSSKQTMTNSNKPSPIKKGDGTEKNTNKRVVVNEK